MSDQQPTPTRLPRFSLTPPSETATPANGVAPPPGAAAPPPPPPPASVTRRTETTGEVPATGSDPSSSAPTDLAFTVPPPASTDLTPDAPADNSTPAAAASVAALAPLVEIEPIPVDDPPASDAIATGDEPARSRRTLLLAGLGVLALLIAGGVVLLGGDDDTSDTIAGADVAATVAVEPAVTAVATTTAPAPATTEPAPSTTAAPTTTQAPTTTAPAAAPYPTLPDGSPEPIVAIYDGPTIRVSGWVPSQEKYDQLVGLAKANSTDPNAVVEGELQIDPSVPSNIGVRVIEMNSPRFPAGSAEILPEHALQLDRVAGVLNLLPNVTATVVGHADQVGDEAANYVLSEARAIAVTRYLVSKGVAPNRLSARAVGEQDLLIADESAEALELNRRTEFIFYGLVAG